MPANYVLLERIELNASAASVTFSNIPQTGYTDLKVVVSARTDRASNYYDFMKMTFNGSTTSYSQRTIQGSGSAASSYTDTIIAAVIDGSTATSSTFASAEFYVPNYTSANYKSVSIDTALETNATAAYMELSAGLWSNTAAITSLTLASIYSANFVQYSTFSLYGLAAVGTTPTIAPKASGGNIYTDGTYWYHAFLASGTFTPQTGITADVLVVAGGGGGGYNFGGGGGAGGLLAFTSQSLSATGYTCTVGSGGAAATSVNGSNGTDSQFGALTLVKGGGGGGGYTGTGQTGGSGGGIRSSNGTPGSATSGQGNAGGAGGPVNSGSGGGGATAVGGTATNPDGGAGGNGSSAYSSWGSATLTGQNVSGTYWYAGGGGGSATNGGGSGGAGGNGGGGAGYFTTGNIPAVAGTINTGGGGGGMGSSGGAGGSGIVIIRYAI
jgi:hypothetical protein